MVMAGGDAEGTLIGTSHILSASSPVSDHCKIHSNPFRFIAMLDSTIPNSFASQLHRVVSKVEHRTFKMTSYTAYSTFKVCLPFLLQLGTFDTIFSVSNIKQYGTNARGNHCTSHPNRGLSTIRLADT